MAVFRGISRSFQRYICPQNPNNSQAQLIFYRGIASKLFVKGIPFSTTEKTLAEAFSQFGQVLEAKIIMDKVKKRPKGFGYVTFATVDEAQKALMEMNGKLLDGRVVFVDNVRPRRYFEDLMPIARGPPEPAPDD